VGEATRHEGGGTKEDAKGEAGFEKGWERHQSRKEEGWGVKERWQGAHVTRNPGHRYDGRGGPALHENAKDQEKKHETRRVDIDFMKERVLDSP